MSTPQQPEDRDRPLVSFLILAYKQVDIVRFAIQGALDQDYSPLEIIISDDCSPDGTFEAAQAMVKDYQGPHRVIVRRNEKNLGIVRHFAAATGVCQGELITGNGGDDISLPERTRVTVAAWLEHDREPDLIACPVIDMDQEGNCHGTIPISDLASYRTIGDWAASPPFIIGAGLAWSRRLLATYQTPLPDGLGHEDQLGIVRAILRNGGITLPTPLVKYRRGGISQKPVLDTGKALAAKMVFDARNDWSFLSRVVFEAGDQLPADDRRKLQKKIGRARHVLDLSEAGALKTLLLTLYSRNADLGFRLRALMHLRASNLIAALNRLKQARRQR